MRQLYCLWSASDSSCAHYWVVVGLFLEYTSTEVMECYILCLVSFSFPLKRSLSTVFVTNKLSMEQILQRTEEEEESHYLAFPLVMMQITPRSKRDWLQSAHYGLRVSYCTKHRNKCNFNAFTRRGRASVRNRVTHKHNETFAIIFPLKVGLCWLMMMLMLMAENCTTRYTLMQLNYRVSNSSPCQRNVSSAHPSN